MFTGSTGNNPIGLSDDEFIGVGSLSSREADVQVVVPVAGTLSSFYVHVGQPAAGASAWRFTLRHNGADTKLTCAFGNNGNLSAVCKDTTDTVALAAGDTIDVRAQLQFLIPFPPLVTWSARMK